MVNLSSLIPTKFQRDDYIIWGACAFAFLVGWNKYTLGEKWFMFDWSPTAWILTPFLIPFIGYVLFGKVTRVMQSEIIIEDPYKLIEEYSNSSVKAYTGEPVDRIEVEWWQTHPKSGNAQFRINENGVLKVLYMDGRKGLSPERRAGTYTLIPVDRMYECGYKTEYDMHKKLSRTFGERANIAQILAGMDEEQLSQILSSPSPAFGKLMEGSE